jgi:hypothetical protein
MKRTLLIIIICLLFLTAFSQGFGPQQVIVQSETKSEKDSVPVQNKNKEIIRYTTRNQALELKLFYSPRDSAFYSEQVSEQAIEYIKNNRDSFYGDQVLNPFAQSYVVPPTGINPGEFHLKYYGSGDMDGNNNLDWDDYALIQSGLQIDEGDIDGDGIMSTTADANLFYNYMIDQTPYLSAHYELNQTETEKINWLENTLAIDSTNFIPPGPNWMCCAYSMQTLINFAGIENISNSGINLSKYDTTQNARFNLPVYDVWTRSINDIAHCINAIIVGDNSLDFNDWYFIEPQNDARVYPGDPSMHPDSYANISRYSYVYSAFLQDTVYGDYPVINFDLNNGNASVSWQHPDLVLTKPEELTHVNISGELPTDTTINCEEPTSVAGFPITQDWATTYYSDSTNQAGGTGDSTYYNYTIWRDHWAKSDENIIIDTTYGTLDTRFNRPPQHIYIQDTTKPEFTYVYNGNPMFYTNYIAGGIPLSQGTDNSGQYTINRTQTSTQGTDPFSCDFYTFSVDIADSIYDPSNNNDTTSFTTPIELDPNQFSLVPAPFTANYGDPLNPGNTGGYAMAFNPAGVGVEISYNDNSNQNPDTTICEHYNYDLNRTWTATDTVCYSFIDSLQPIYVIKPMSLVWDTFPPNITIGKNDPIHPDYTGWPDGHDTITPWAEELKEYYDTLIEITPTYELWDRYWNLRDSICTNLATLDSIQEITRDLTTRIGDNQQNGKSFIVKIFPNPTNNIINVSYNKEFLLEIYDITGRKLLYSNSKTTDVSQLSKGIYILLIKDEQGVLLRKEKLIVE